MNKNLLFDYGGTLDTAALHWFYVFQKAYAHCGLTVPEDRLRQAYVEGERALARTPVIAPTDDFHTLLYKKVHIQMEALTNQGYLEYQKPARNAAAEAVAAYCDNYAREEVGRSACVLEKLAESHRLFVVSNFYGNLSAVLRAYGIDGFFDEVIESAVVGVRKPMPAIWQLGVDAAGGQASQCTAIGDSYSKDIVPAAAVGCETVWFKGREWEEKSYDETVPTHIITSLPDLLRLG